MIASMNPPSAAALSCSAMAPSWVVKPTNRTLPVFLIASISFFHLPALDPIDLAFAQAVVVEQVDVVGAERVEPLIDVLETSPIPGPVPWWPGRFACAPRAFPRTIS